GHCSKGFVGRSSSRALTGASPAWFSSFRSGSDGGADLARAHCSSAVAAILRFCGPGAGRAKAGNLLVSSSASSTWGHFLKGILPRPSSMLIIFQKSSCFCGADRSEAGSARFMPRFTPSKNVHWTNPVAGSSQAGSLTALTVRGLRPARLSQLSLPKPFLQPCTQHKYATQTLPDAQASCAILAPNGTGLQAEVLQVGQ